MDNISYRVEAHDGNSWGFGICVNPNSRRPEYCALSDADRFETRDGAFTLADRASLVCGGTLRVVCLRNHGGLLEEITAVPIA